MASLRPLFVVCAFVVVALGAAGGASATSFGVADDTGKYADDGGRWFYSQLLTTGLRDNRISIPWDASRPTQIPDKAFLDRSMPVAALLGVRVVASVFPARPTMLTDSPEAPAQFVAFLQQLARTYPSIRDVKVGNEPNQPRFWRPQFNEDGTPASPAAYEAVLAQAYDALKAVDPSIDVIGLGLSSRGNDDADAANNISTSPVRFVQGVGEAYQASGRTRSIMDELGFHPYPRSSQDSLDKGFQWPNAGVANLDRIKQAVWDAFGGTAQPTFENGLTLAIDEVGWQVAIAPAAQQHYQGAENAPTTDEATQAQIYADLVHRVTCDATVTKLYVFGFVDERDLSGFQSALLRADRSRRPAWDALASAIRETGGRCTGTPVLWRHSTTVAGARAVFKPAARPKLLAATSWSFSVTAEEDASYEAGLFRVDPRRGASKAGFERALLGARAPKPVLATSGRIQAYWTPLVQFSKQRIGAGSYVYAARLTAETNPKRSAFFVSTAFRVGARRGGR